jgi:hypothetical protein
MSSITDMHEFDNSVSELCMPHPRGCCFQLRRPGFNREEVLVGFAVDKSGTMANFPQILQFSPADHIIIRGQNNRPIYGHNSRGPRLTQENQQTS